MGLFDKKFCDICGEKIGMLGNKKLEDGNMCKDCAKKLSPFCDDRRRSTLEQIKQHLQYRETNKAVLRGFTPTLVLGENKKFYIDQMNRTFVVSRHTPGDWDEENPDVIPVSQIISCSLDIDEDEEEIYMTNSEGDEVSYNPPRYNYSYDFTLKFLLNNPYFDDFEIQLNSFSVEGQQTMEYGRYQQMGMDIMNALGVRGAVNMNGNMGMQGGMNNMYAQPQVNMGYQQNMYAQPQPNLGYQQNMYAQPVQNNMPYQQMPQQPYPQPMQNNMPYQQPYAQQVPQNNAGFSHGWTCPNCGSVNQGAFCPNCGRPRG